jgi:hypothetical protein
MACLICALYDIVFIINNIGVPRILRSDCGTENTNIAFLQPYLRRNHADCFSGSASFRYGKSVSNQVFTKYYVVNVYQIFASLDCIAYRGLVVTAEEVVHPVVV